MSNYGSDSLVPYVQKARRQVVEPSRLKQTPMKPMSW